MNETLNNTMAVIMIVILCLLALTVFAIGISVLLDAIRDWKEHKKHEMPKRRK